MQLEGGVVRVLLLVTVLVLAGSTSSACSGEDKAGPAKDSSATIVRDATTDVRRYTLDMDKMRR